MPEEGNPNLSNPGLTGNAETVAGKRRDPGEAPDNWATRTHPDHPAWVEAEARQRASYIATRSALSRFLVPHKTEGGEKRKSQVRRAKYGFGIGLNAMWVQSIMGHIRSAEARRVWGSLSADDEEEIGRPGGGVAQRIWDDATLENESWANLMGGTVLDRMLSSPGGWLLVDSSKRHNRPKFRFFPWSSVEDYGWGQDGLRWIKFAERRDVSTPRMKKEKDRYEHHHLLYELNDQDETVVSRWDDEATQIGDDIEVGKLVDFQGQATLPLVPVGFGEHPEIEHVAAGLLLGLDDIVIDTYNQLSEIREAYRDFAFSLFAIKGPEGTQDKVEESFEKDSYLVYLGSDESASLNRVHGTTPEVGEGLQIVDLQLKAWALSARRKSVEAMEGAQARSGVSLKAEFQLDEKPLLVTVAERLDEVESLAMFLAAQVNDENFKADSEEARQIGVTRSTEFQMEEEPSRISRLLTEFRDAIPRGIGLSPTAARKAAMSFLESSEVVDLDQEVGMEEGEDRTLREIVEQELTEALESEATARQNGGVPTGLPQLR